MGRQPCGCQPRWITSERVLKVRVKRPYCSASKPAKSSACAAAVRSRDHPQAITLQMVKRIGRWRRSVWPELLEQVVQHRFSLDERHGGRTVPLQATQGEVAQPDVAAPAIAQTDVAAESAVLAE